MTAAERQRRCRQRLGIGTASAFTNRLNADVKRKLGWLALHRGCSVTTLLRDECPRLIERWATTAEKQLAEQLKRKGGQAALKRYSKASRQSGQRSSRPGTNANYPIS